MSKGSRPRPINRQKYNEGWDRIFGKNKQNTKDVKMQVRLNEDKNNIGSCGCGRSPTGKCCGWHALTEDAYREELARYEDRINRETHKQNQSVKKPKV
jgi:hypothetical protein